MIVESAWRDISMTISKKPLLELEPYSEEYEWNSFMIALGTLIKERFKTGYVKCSAKNMGWRNLSGYKVFKCDTDREEDYVAADFLRSFVPDCDWCASVYSLNGGKGLYFNLFHHDSPTGESYYLTPISERTFDRLS